MKKILILSGLSLLAALAVRAQDKVTEYNVRPAVAVRTPIQGDSINFSLPNSKTRRGRVGKQIANTLLTGEEQAVIVQKPRGFNKGGEHDIAPTLSSNSWQENNLLKSGFRIRKLTPRECWRLQGFPDWAFDKAQEVNSNSQLYKQAGNSVTVPVIYEIARRFE